MPGLLQFAKFNLQLELQQVACPVRIGPEDVGDPHEHRLVIEHHATVWRQTHFTIRESIQRIEHLVRRHVVGQMNHHLHLVGGVVFHFFDLDLALVVGFQNAVNQRTRSDPVRHLTDHQRLVVQLVNPGTHAHPVPPEAVVVVFDIRHAPRRKVRIKFESLVLVVRNARIDEFDEVVRQNLACQPHGNAVDP